MLNHTLWQRQIVVAAKLAIRHGGRMWWSRVLGSRWLRAALRSSDFYVYNKEGAPEAEGRNNFAPSRGPISGRRICELESGIVLARRHRTWCWECWGWAWLFARSHVVFRLGHQCPFRVTFTVQGSSLGHISCPETAHHMKASKSPQIRSPGPKGPEPTWQSHRDPTAVPPCAAAVISSGSHLLQRHMQLAISVHQACGSMRLFL
jgi:hypothetical protein